MKALIFDLDGTLLNTLADIGAAANAALAMHGYPTHPTEEYAFMVGNGFNTLIARAVPHTTLPHLSSADLDTIVNDARAYYAKHPHGNTSPYPGICDALHELAARDKKLAVLSNKMDDLTNVLIRHFFPTIPFEQVVGSKPGKPMKPDPTCLNSILQEMRLQANECLYVGDSNVDVATAHAAKMKVVGVAWGFRGSKELEENGADYIITKAADLLTLADAIY